MKEVNTRKEEKKAGSPLLSKIIRILSGKPEEEVFEEVKAPEILANDPLDLQFVKRFTHEGGKFLYCESLTELRETLNAIRIETGLKTAHFPQLGTHKLMEAVGFPFTAGAADEASFWISDCECLVAQLGGIMISSNQTLGKPLNAMPKIFVFWAEAGQFVERLNEGLTLIREKHSGHIPNQITTVRGPKVQAVGMGNVQGPTEVYLILTERFGL